MKRCKGCGTEKPLAEFYKDSTSRDGVRGKCKTCLLTATREYRKTEKGRQAAILATRKYQSTDRGKLVLDAYKKSQDRWLAIRRYWKTENYKMRNRVYARVRKALMTGKLIRQACEICGDPNSQAHHTDYSKPLDITWLCRIHHLAEHGRAAHAA